MNEQKKITEETINELAKVGYWGLLVEPKYGGSGVPFGAFALVVDTLRQSGIQNISVVTEPLDETPH